MNKKILTFFIFSFLIKNIYSLKIESFTRIKKDITDRREPLVDIQFFDIKYNLVSNYLDLRANLFKREPYNQSMSLKLGLPFKIGSKNIFLGLKGAHGSYFFNINSKSIEGNFKIYIKTLFKNKEKNIKYGFESSMAHFNDNEVKFSFIESYLNYWYKNQKFVSRINFKAGIKEYYKTEKPMSSIKNIFSSQNNEKAENVKNLGEKLQNIEEMLKINNKRHRKTFLKIFSRQKYSLMNEFSIGVEEKFNYSMISTNQISKIFIKVSPFVQLRYKLFKNLFLSHKFQFIFSHGFSVLNNSIYILFETNLKYSF